MNKKGKNRAYAILLGMSVVSLCVDQMIGYDKPQQAGAATLSQPSAQPTAGPANEAVNVVAASSKTPTAVYQPTARHHISLHLEKIAQDLPDSDSPVTQAFLPDKSWISQETVNENAKQATTKTASQYAQELKVTVTMADSAFINGSIVQIGQKIEDCTLLKVAKEGVLVLTPTGRAIVTLDNRVIVPRN